VAHHIGSSCCSVGHASLARYLGYLLTEFDQTCISNGFCGKDEHIKSWGKDVHIKFWGQKVKVQGHSVVKYAPKCTFWPCSCHLFKDA